MLSSFVKPLYLSSLPGSAGGLQWSWVVIGACQGPCIWVHTHIHCVRLIEMDVMCVWASRENECMWQTVNQPVMRGNRTVDRSISFFSGETQKKNTTVLQVNDLHFSALFSFLYLSVILWNPIPLFRASTFLPLYFEFGCLVVYLCSFLLLPLS